MPFLLSLLGPATWVWSTNCTNSVPGAQNTSCAASPVGLNPVFNATNMTVNGSSETYLGLQSVGGFTSYATQINISTPCIQGKLSEPLACFDQLPAVMGYNITSDTWLPYQTPNVVGTLGMGIASPFWFQTNQTFTSTDNGT